LVSADNRILEAPLSGSRESAIIEQALGLFDVVVESDGSNLSFFVLQMTDCHAWVLQMRVPTLRLGDLRI
jgi:hypothetical protein